jgi:hypothetical protein
MSVVANAELRWRRVPYAMGQYESVCGRWAVCREWQNGSYPYVVYLNGQPIRGFEFDLDAAFALASAMSAGTAETEGLRAKPASAVPEGRTPNHDP